MNKITAVIPVREGSTRVKNKNIRPFAGTTLLENKIKQLKSTKGIGELLFHQTVKSCLKLYVQV